MEKERVNKITDSEWQIMEQIWAYTEDIDKEYAKGKAEALRMDKKGISQPCLMEQLGNKWNKNTVHTFLSRLCDKGYLKVIKEVSPHSYVPLISREDCEKVERQSFLERVYQGSAGRMVAALVRDGGLNKKEAAELRKLLDEIED